MTMLPKIITWTDLLLTTNKLYCQSLKNEDVKLLSFLKTDFKKVSY
jgi:hypothetical protein